MKEKNKIKIIIIPNYIIGEDEKEIIKLERNKAINRVQVQFDNYFRGIECDICKENSKGTIVIELSKGYKSAILESKDFCCINFNIEANNIIK